jgi:outer membrane protein TolC
MMKWGVLIYLLVCTSAAFAETWSFKDQVNRISSGRRGKEIAQSEFDLARAKSMAGQWSALPSVSASTSRRMTVDHAHSSRASLQNEMSLDLSMNLFRFGSDYASYHSASEGVRAAEINRSINLLTADTAAAKILCDAISAQMEYDVYERRITAARQSIVAAEARYNKGLLSEQELSKLKLDAAQVELALLAAKRKAEMTRDIAQALGANVPKQVVWPLVAEQGLYDRAKTWVASLKSAELKIKALEAQVSAASSAITAARGSLLPSIDVSAVWTRSGDPDFQKSTSRQDYLAKLSVPIVSGLKDYGHYRAQIREAAILSASLDVERLTSKRQFEFEVEEVKAGLDEARERQAQIGIAEQLFQDNLKRFERGLISVNELSIDEQRVRDSELKAIESWARVHVDLFKLAEQKGVSLVETSEVF